MTHIPALEASVDQVLRTAHWSSSASEQPSPTLRREATITFCVIDKMLHIVMVPGRNCVFDFPDFLNDLGGEDVRACLQASLFVTVRHYDARERIVMSVKSPFLDKLLERIDRVDPESLHVHFMRLAQERGLLETIFQSIQEGVLVVDGDKRLTYANRAAGQLLGFDVSATLGRPVQRYVRELEWDRILEVDDDEWSTLITREIEISYPEHRFVSFYVVPLRQEGESEGGAVLILRDVTKDRVQEASVLESERLNAVKLLAAGVAHEIGNPLNALNIHLQLLDREIRALSADGAAANTPPRDHDLSGLGELVSVARNEVSRLDLIITQFLRAIRPTTPRLVPARIERLIEEALTLLRHEVQNRNIEIEVVTPTPLPEIKVDRDQIKQAFFNLIKNAFQAMPDGGALTITMRCDQEFLVITFEDTGVGINPEDFGLIFEPYHTTKSSGSGLGLMIVQRIVQEHGGQIEVVSAPGKGTRFTIQLPLAERRIRLLNAPAAASAPAAAPMIAEPVEEPAHDD